MSEAIDKVPFLERHLVLKWVVKNLISPWYNALLSLVILFTCGKLFSFVFTWLFYEAQFFVISDNLALFFMGIYPREEAWRLWLLAFFSIHFIAFLWGTYGGEFKKEAKVFFCASFLLFLLPSSFEVKLWISGIPLLAFASYYLASLKKSSLSYYLKFVSFAFIPLCFLLLAGLPIKSGPMLFVPSHLWSGLVLTFLISFFSIVFSFPLGLLLALARRSELKVLKTLSIIYIEVIRGVPLITVLFLMQVMFPLFLSDGIQLDRVFRAILGFIFFTAAYLAEDIRGGLNTLEKGQEEAAFALGLSYVQSLRYIVLPQAIRSVIPVIVGRFISVFKDSSLVAIVGLLDLLGMAQSILANPKFLGLQKEVYLFIALVYWLVAIFMSIFSERLETVLGNCEGE